MKLIYFLPLLIFVTVPAFANIGFMPVYQPTTTGGANPAELYCTFGEFLNSYNSTTNSFTCGAGGGGGQNNTASNLGAGLGWYKQKVGVDLQFNSALAGQGIDITDTTDDLTIATDFKIDTLPTVGIDQFIASFDNSTGDWLTKTFSINSVDCGSDFVQEINNSTGAIICAAATGGVSDGDKGDITVSGSGAIWTIDNTVVTYAKIQNVASDDRFLGRISGAGGTIEELTGTQATTLLDVFTSALNGLVPASGGGTTNFLRADGSWASVSASAPSSGYLMAHWTMSQTRSNIGTSFADVYQQTNSNGKASFIHSGSSTTVRLQIEWNKVGTGTQSCQIVDIANAANILVTLTVVSGSNDSGFVAIPADLLNVEKNYKIQCKSTTGTDDPVFESASIWIK